MKKYLCLAADEHTPETDMEIAIADTGICPFCGSQLVWEEYEEVKTTEKDHGHASNNRSGW